MGPRGMANRPQAVRTVLKQAEGAGSSGVLGVLRAPTEQECGRRQTVNSTLSTIRASGACVPLLPPRVSQARASVLSVLRERGVRFCFPADDNVPCRWRNHSGPLALCASFLSPPTPVSAPALGLTVVTETGWRCTADCCLVVRGLLLEPGAGWGLAGVSGGVGRGRVSFLFLPLCLWSVAALRLQALPRVTRLSGLQLAASSTQVASPRGSGHLVEPGLGLACPGGWLPALQVSRVQPAAQPAVQYSRGLHRSCPRASCAWQKPLWGLHGSGDGFISGISDAQPCCRPWGGRWRRGGAADGQVQATSCF